MTCLSCPTRSLPTPCDVGCSRAQHSVPRRCPRLWGTERSTGIRRWPVYLARASQFPLRGSDQQPDTDFVDSSVGSTLLARGEPSAPHGCFVHGRLDVESFFLPCIPRANPWRLVAGNSLGLLAPSVPRSRPSGRRDCVRSRSIGRFCTAPTPSARALSTRVTPVSPVVSLERNARVRLPARSCVGWTREPGGRASVAFMVEGNNTADAALPHSIRSLARSPFAPLHGPGTTLRRSFGTRQLLSNRRSGRADSDVRRGAKPCGRRGRDATPPPFSRNFHKVRPRPFRPDVRDTPRLATLVHACR